MKSTSLAPVLAACALAACGETETQPLDARAVALTADTNFRRVAVELAESAAFLSDSKLLGGAFAGGCDDAPPPPATAFDDAPCDAADPGADAEAIADFLAARVFTEANVEQGESELTFRLRPEVVCEAGDEGCRDLLESVPVRLRVTSVEEGDLDVTVLVGSERAEVLEIGLHADALELQGNLAGMKRALSLFGAPADALPEQMAGRIGVGIARHGAGDFTASLSVLETLAVHGDDWGIDLDTALPAVAVRLREGQRQVDVNFGLGALALRGPLEALFAAPADGGCTTFDDCVEPPALDGIFDLRLAGLTGATTLTTNAAGEDELRIRGLGLGAKGTVLAIDDTPVFTIDVNPLAGRIFDLVVVADERGAQVEVQPSLDLGLGFSFGDTAHDLGVPDWALDENLRIRLDGGVSLFDAAPSLDGAPRPVAEVTEGTLTLESKAYGAVAVEGGMCLLAPPAADAQHPFASLAAGACE